MTNRQILIEEAKRRGFDKGVSFKWPHEPEITTIQNKITTAYYDKTSGFLSVKVVGYPYRRGIYWMGTWATIVE